MKPIKFEGYEAELGAPAGWDAEKRGPCGGLPILRHDGSCLSCWQPSFIERLRILIGADVFLWVVSGRTQPPVALVIEHSQPVDEGRWHARLRQLLNWRKDPQP